VNVGVDVGTTAVKAAVFDEEGAVVRSRSVPAPLLSRGNGWFEYDAAQVANAVRAVVTEVVRPDPAAIRLIAVTGQGDGLWLLDEDGASTHAPVSWLDGRAGGVCREWSDSGTAQKVFARTANACFPGAGAAILAHLDRHQPHVLDRAAVATQCQHAVVEQLSGERGATASAAMLPVLDPVSGGYDDDAVDLLGLGHRKGLLPPVTGDVHVRPLRDDQRRLLGLGAGTVVASGPYDLPAAALGVGLAQVGDGMVILGTTLACQVWRDEVDASGAPVGLTLRRGDGSGWLRAMPAMVGMAGIDWVMRLVGADVRDLDALLRASGPGSNGVRALPYFSPAGERAPFADQGVRAELTGLSLETSPADVVRAVCEALAYVSRQCLEAAGLVGSVSVCGGGAQSAELVQIFADVLARQVTIVPAEPAARGAVQAAALAVGTGPPAPARAGVIEPCSRRHPGYEDGYADHLERVQRARAAGRTSTPAHGWATS
jgi:sugar (pentulose or hexulose) kinase